MSFGEYAGAVAAVTMATILVVMQVWTCWVSVGNEIASWWIDKSYREMQEYPISKIGVLGSTMQIALVAASFVLAFTLDHRVWMAWVGVSSWCQLNYVIWLDTLYPHKQTDYFMWQELRETLFRSR